MSRRKLRYGWLTVAVLMGLAAGADAAQMRADLQNDRIYYGTSTLLVIQIENLATEIKPTVPEVENVTITPYGGASVTRDLFNGTVIRRYRYLITPQKPGTLTIPAVKLELPTGTLSDGPFTLEAIEAPLRFMAAEIEPKEIVPRESARLTVAYEGFVPNASIRVPPVEGLTITPNDQAKVEIDRRSGKPITIQRFSVSGSRVGDYVIEGIDMNGVAADAVRLIIRSFVVAASKVQNDSLIVGGQTTLHLVIRGLPQGTKLKLITPPGLKAEQIESHMRNRIGEVFSFQLTALQPGSPTIEAFELADGSKVRLGEPIVLTVRREGEGGILACRGIPRSEETVAGEPFVVDFELFFSGDLQGAGIDLSQSGLQDKSYIKIEAVADPDYPGWKGTPINGVLDNQRMTLFAGTGTLNGQSEQMLRFSLRITPMAAGELSLDNIRVVVQLMIRREQRTAFGYSQSTTMQTYDRVAEVPPHRVIDPPGINAPAGYRGAVGKSFDFSTELDRTSATAMSPLTLTMTITGESVGPDFQPPRLAEMPELTRRFDVSQTVGGGEVEGDTITFTQAIRPRDAQVREVPALPLVYYDYVDKKYRTVYSLPIEIEVRPGSLVGAGQMEVTAAPSADEPPAAERDDAIDLGANYGHIGTVTPDKWLPWQGVLGLLLGGPALIAMVALGRRTWHKRRPTLQNQARRRELIQALGGLSRAEHFHMVLSRIVQDYLRVRFDLPAGELSSDDLRGGLVGRADAENEYNEIRTLLNECDAGRFASGGIDEQQRNRLTEQARKLLKKLEQSS